MTSPRPASAVDQLTDTYTEELLALDPVLATNAGIAGHDDRWTDFSRDGASATADLARRTLAHLDRLTPADEVDVVTIAAVRERLGLIVELDEAELSYGRLRVIDSPFQTLREVFDLAPTASESDWEAISARLTTMPQAAASALAGLRTAIERGTAPARRQVVAVADAMDRTATSTAFTDLIDGAPDTLPAALLARLQDGARTARATHTDLARTLREEILPTVPDVDACGPQAYALWSREHLGATIDLAETYQWGLEELARIEAEMAETAREILGSAATGLSGPELREAATAALDADPARRLSGTDALREWMQHTSDSAVAALGASQFDIAPEIRRLECRIAPSQEGGIYYTGPSEDLSRPGQMWWSVPEGVDSFTTWQEKTTVYHEGVPGHHLQIAQTILRTDTLNRWRRLICWVSGHGEGWALYAERLMDELGYLSDPGDRLGMLDSAAFRATRVVVDIGLHCGFTAPDEVGGGVWDVEAMWRFLRTHCAVEEKMLRFEQLRYLGWPGQAPSYKVGERLWRQARAAAQAADPESFDLKTFHRQALDLGSVGLDVLRAALAPGALQ